MQRRTMLEMLAGAGAALTARNPALEATQAEARRGAPSPKITDVRAILTQPGGDHFVIVKVVTDQILNEDRRRSCGE